MLAEDLTLLSLLGTATLIGWRYGRRHTTIAIPTVCGLVGAAFWIWVGGLRILDPREIGWTMRLDWQWHFLGWHFFRHEAWQLPPGRITSEFFPVGTAVAYTDSLPLLAFLLKPFSSVLPDPFQYLGIWLVVCYALQGVCAARLISIWTGQPGLVVTASALIILNPVLLNRVGHVALCSHWLILLALTLHFRTRDLSVRRALLYWSTLTVLASLIHPYLWLMVGTFGLSGAVAMVIEKKVSPTVAALGGCFGAAVSGLGAWAAGWFLIRSANATAEGFGTLSMNLLGPLAANGWSTIVPNLPVFESQTYEGFNYLGVGAMALIGVATVECARRRPTSETMRALAPLFAACGVLAVFAVGNRVTFGQHVIAEVRLPALLAAVLSPARASGRFFWPAGYLLVLASIAVTLKRYTARQAGLLLAIAVALQAYDLYAQCLRDRAVRSAESWYAWDDLSKDPQWQRAAAISRHVILVPPDDCGVAAAPYAPIGVFAAPRHVTLNAGHAARFDLAAVKAACAAVNAQLESGNLDPGTIYVVHVDERDRVNTALGGAVQCWPTLDAWACIAPP
jgi:hypothetical protein